MSLLAPSNTPSLTGGGWRDAPEQLLEGACRPGCYLGVATGNSPLEGRFGPCEVVLLLEQHPQVDRCLGRRRLDVTASYNW